MQHFACSTKYFPLTPALSLGERENGPPLLDHTRAGVYATTIGKTPNRRPLFPLPEGEGQGGPKTTLLLLAAPAAENYYPHVGFTHHPQAWLLNPGDGVK